MRFRVIFLTGLLLIATSLHAQDRKDHPREVALIVLLDDVTQKLGVRDDEIRSAASSVLESRGWVIDAASDLTLTITVRPVTQREEDLYAFSIFVAAGFRPDSTPETSGGSGGGVRAGQTIDVPPGDTGRVVESVRRLLLLVSEGLNRDEGSHRR